MWCDYLLRPTIVLLNVKFSREARFSLKDVTVKNCFKKARFCISTDKQVFLPENNSIKAEPSNLKWAKLECHESGDVLTPTFEVSY